MQRDILLTDCFYHLKMLFLLEFVKHNTEISLILGPFVLLYRQVTCGVLVHMFFRFDSAVHTSKRFFRVSSYHS